jgi:excinuclease UvrABC nuclease subunit
MINITNPMPEPITNKLENIKEAAGIYLLYNKEKDLLYIGQSDNIWDRIRQQLPKYNAHYFAVCYEKDPYKRAIYEISMINAMKPKENKQFNF